MWKTAIAALTRISGAAALSALAGCGMGTANLRQDHGPLAPCPPAPHCVSSQSADPDHRVAPLRYDGSRAQARGRLLKILSDMPRAKVRKVEPDYIYATFTSVIFRFVDDVEFLLPADQHVIQVRSSSRIGYYDFGVNRDRVERIRKAFEGETR